MFFHRNIEIYHHRKAFQLCLEPGYIYVVYYISCCRNLPRIDWTVAPPNAAFYRALHFTGYARKILFIFIPCGYINEWIGHRISFCVFIDKTLEPRVYTLITMPQCHKWYNHLVCIVSYPTKTDINFLSYLFISVAFFH